MNDRTIQTSNLRTIEPIPEIAKFAITPQNKAPRMMWVDPLQLSVDETYQRNLSMKSKKLITNIVQNFDWTRFKCPIVTQDEKERMFVLDGQHTAIAAATHPEIEKIPVMIVEADSLKKRARAFIGHNKDRINMTATQLHHSSVVAEDATAMTIDRVCRASGIKIVRVSPMARGFSGNETTAISAIRGLITKYGEDKAIEVLSCVARAMLAPVRADHIRAAAHILLSETYAGEFGSDEVAQALIDVDFSKAIREARDMSHETGTKVWESLATLYVRNIEEMKEAA